MPNISGSAKWQNSCDSKMYDALHYPLNLLYWTFVYFSTNCLMTINDQTEPVETKSLFSAAITTLHLRFWPALEYSCLLRTQYCSHLVLEFQGLQPHEEFGVHHHRTVDPGVGHNPLTIYLYCDDY